MKWYFSAENLKSFQLIKREKNIFEKNIEFEKCKKKKIEIDENFREEEKMPDFDRRGGMRKLET